MTMVNAYAGDADLLPQDDQELLRRREAALGAGYRLFYNKPLHFKRGQGVFLFDQAGDVYLDVYNNVACVGHCHPHVVAALAEQAAVLNTHTRYLSEPIVAYAERLLANFPKALNNIMFTCTGSEANDLALRMAESFTGGRGFIVTELAYHGATNALAQLSPSLGSLVNLGPNCRTVPAPDSLRVPPNELGAYFADGVRKAINDLQRHGVQPAALLIDTIFSSDGVYTEPAGFLKEAVAAIRQAGGLVIADEVQPGFCRTGEAMWGFERHGIVPDMVSLGKPMGNGHPLAGLVVKQTIADSFGKKSRYFNTFGGNPVSCAVGMAVLDVLEQEHLQQSAREVGAYLRANLDALAKAHSVLSDVRGAGLFIGVEIAADGPVDSAAALTTKIVNGLRDHHVLIGATGSGNVLKIRPPLVFTKQHANLFIEKFDSVLRTVSR